MVGVAKTAAPWQIGELPYSQLPEWHGRGLVASRGAQDPAIDFAVRELCDST